MSEEKYTNNFYGNMNGVQIQQGTSYSTQSQIVEHEISYEEISELVNAIKKHDEKFDEEFGSNAVTIREKINEIETLVETKQDSGRIKVLLLEIKNLASNIGGSLIASGIVGLISNHLG